MVASLELTTEVGSMVLGAHPSFLLLLPRPGLDSFHLSPSKKGYIGIHTKAEFKVSPGIRIVHEVFKNYLLWKISNIHKTRKNSIINLHGPSYSMYQFIGKFVYLFFN